MTEATDSFPSEDDFEAPSKSRLKREMTERQKLGKSLTSLSIKQLEHFSLDDELLEAIKDHQRFKHRS